MATSPNYGWSEPDNSSLVKNGAADIRTLGDAIDTSLWNVGFGQAGKNKIINGDFGIWQRGTSFSPGSYNADRWRYDDSGGATTTISRQTFTPGTAPVAGYEGKFFYRAAVTTAAAYQAFQQYIEDVQTFAGNTVTLSFWIKAGSATTISAYLDQNFGSGGSSTVTTTVSTSIPATTSWTRVNYTVTLPSISGKTIGTGSSLGVRMVIGAGTFDFWGFQLEYGSKATPFQTASGSTGGSELALCHRYYYRQGGSSNYQVTGSGMGVAAGAGQCKIIMPVQMRVSPTVLDSSTLAWADQSNAITAAVGLSIVTNQSSNNIAYITSTNNTLTQYRPYDLITNNSTSAYLGLGAEL